MAGERDTRTPEEAASHQAMVTTDQTAGRIRQIRRTGIAYVVDHNPSSFVPEPETPEQRAVRITDNRARFRRQTQQREF